MNLAEHSPRTAGYVEAGYLGSKGTKVLQLATPTFPPRWQLGDFVIS